MHPQQLEIDQQQRWRTRVHTRQYLTFKEARKHRMAIQTMQN